MARKKATTSGQCNICGSIYSKSQMARHLKSCTQKGLADGTSKKRGAQKMAFHLVIEGRYLPEYWMHLDVSASSDLDSLDAFLRDTWLECCGHLSAFQIEGTMYSVQPAGIRDEPMTARLNQVLSPGLTFYYEYDFGDSTHLRLKVVSEHESDLRRSEMRLLAQNEAPIIPCSACGKAATQICMECVYSGAGWLCERCADKHECDEEMLLPVVNSPRTGVCGYTGRDDADWLDEEE